MNTMVLLFEYINDLTKSTAGTCTCKSAQQGEPQDVQ